jgi:flavin reductase (NADH)/flavin reductase
LARDQQEVAETFAGRTLLAAEDRFRTGTWVDRDGAAPRLVGAVATFDCRLDRIVDFTTHLILIGQVVGTTVDESAALPLVYLDGRFTTTANAAQPG